MSVVPSPPTMYPESYWLITAISHVITDTHKLVTVTTDVAVTLSMFYSPYGPYPEPRTKIVRGEPTDRDPHITFHPWGWIYQEEPRPVKVHTFIIPREEIPSEIWYYFIGGYFVYQVCPRCGYYPVLRDKTWMFYCRTCHNFFAFPIWFKCPICKSYDWRYGLWKNFRCPNCDLHGNVDDLKSVWESKSHSPFFHQVWVWCPIYDLIFHEPWSSTLPDMALIFFEPWSSSLPDFVLLWEEPWSR